MKNPSPSDKELQDKKTKELEHFHAMLSHGWIGKGVRALLGPARRSRERGPDRLGRLSDASEITENALEEKTIRLIQNLHPH